MWILLPYVLPVLKLSLILKSQFRPVLFLFRVEKIWIPAVVCLVLGFLWNLILRILDPLEYLHQMLFLPILGLIGSLCLPHKLAPTGQLLCPRFFFDTHLPTVRVSPEFRSYGIVCPLASAGGGPLPASLLLLLAWNQRWNKVQIMWKHCHDMLISAQVSLSSLWYPKTRKKIFFDLDMHLWMHSPKKTTSTSRVGVRVITLGVGPPASSGTSVTDQLHWPAACARSWSEWLTLASSGILKNLGY